MTPCRKTRFTPVAAAALLWLAGAFGPVQAQAETPADTRHVALDYEVYLGGFHTFSISYDAQFGRATYDMKVALDGKGILDWWFSWTMKAFSHGRLTERGVVPVRAGADSSWNGKRRQTRLVYPPNGPPSVEITPLPEDDGDREVVPPALRRDARDLSGALFALLSRIGADGRCDGREAVFDGRRRYDLVLTHLGEDRLKANSYSPYSGPSLRCHLEIERIAGYRRDGERSRWRKGDSAIVWLGQVFDGLPPVPVRLELDTLMGGLVAHLVKARHIADGSEQRLVQVR